MSFKANKLGKTVLKTCSTGKTPIRAEGFSIDRGIIAQKFKYLIGSQLLGLMVHQG